MKRHYFGIFFLIFSCNLCDKKHIADTACFENFQISILKESTKQIDFSKQINCFEWDSLKIGERGSYEKYPCAKFHQICKKGCDTYLGKNLENHMDWLDRDRHWTFIYFYKNGTVLNDALAIPESVASFDELKENNGYNLFYEKENTEFRLTDFVYGGISGKELQNHRQILK